MVGEGIPGNGVSPRSPLDVGLLTGFRFRCRPECGLCCYAAPAVTPAERRRLLRIEPASEFAPGDGGFAFSTSRPDGGACQFLTRERCRVHAARPFPCREYPLLVHVGTRPQATLVLTCPGVDLSGLDPGTTDPPPPFGLGDELAAVEREMADAPVDDWVREGARLWRSIRKRWARPEPGLEELRDRARRGDLPDSDPLPLPPRSEGLAALPLVFVAGERRVGLADSGGGVELVAIAESGGGHTLGSYAVPARTVALAPAGRRRLGAYLEYWTRRDLFVWQRLAAGPSAGGNLEEDLAADLGGIAATVRHRAWALARARGESPAALDTEHVDAGIQATDADLLDRRTLGRIL